MSENTEFDPRYPFFSGKINGTDNEYDLYMYLFDLYRIAACIDVCRGGIKKVNIFCFDYQMEYIKSILEKDDIVKDKIKFFPISEERGREFAYG